MEVAVACMPPPLPAPVAAAVPQLTPTAARLRLQKLRPSVSEAVDLARARGKMVSGTGVPSRMPGELPLFVGNGAHASDLKGLEKLNITAVLNCAPSVCKDPIAAYKTRGIGYLALDAQDDRSFPLLEKCLPAATTFISKMHAEGRGVLVHCMAGVNRSATLAVAHLLLRERRNLLGLFAECSAARPSILQNPSFQLQLCSLAHRHGLLTDDVSAGVAAGKTPAAAPEASQTTLAGAVAGAAATTEPAARPGAAAASEPTSGDLKAHTLTGNREMAEDLERVECEVCGRTFAPSVHVRHLLICKARDAKAKAKAVSGVRS